MNLRLPLFARFLGWFFLNLVLLTVAGWLAVRSELRIEPVLRSLAGERAQRTVDTLIAELRERPAAEWTDILARYALNHDVQFLLFADDGRRLAGPELALPEPVLARLRSGRGGPRPERPDAPPRGGEGRPPGTFGGLRPPPGEGRRLPAVPRSFLHTAGPGRYWLLFDAALPNGLERRPARLVIGSETLAAGGLFFDFKPWLGTAAAVLALSVLWWIPFVRGITRAVSQVTLATEQIAEGKFDVAVNARRGDELGRLGGAINRMAARLAGFVTGQKRFLGDIAHELCSPLARMEMALGVLDQRADEQQRAYVADVRDEVRHMSGLVNELLSFSKAGLKAKDLPLTPVRLAELVGRVIAREASPEDGVLVEVPAGLSAQADPELLARALGNLLRNALRYAGSAGPITIRAAAVDGHVTLTVADQGPGVPPDALAKLGEPFFRPDAARAREDGGTGLGLAIVRTCAEACQGTVTFRLRQPSGLEAELKLRRV